MQNRNDKSRGEQMEKQLCHLVFYDGNCGLCDRIVRFLLKKDQRHLFIFAPLQGETASLYLKQLPPEMKFSDSLILIENYRSSSPRITILAKGALRIAWLLGWPWIVVGLLSFFPGWMFDWIYSLIASNRDRFFAPVSCFVPPAGHEGRFLP